MQEEHASNTHEIPFFLFCILSVSLCNWKTKRNGIRWEEVEGGEGGGERWGVLTRNFL